jgi:thiosulfate/3-mercaptopyruvate sulfurtransferase
MDCDYSFNEKENKTREESIQKELDANEMTAEKNYIIYDTNDKDAAVVKEYLEGLGYQNLSTYNATELINSGEAELVSYENYNLYLPAEVVKNISDHVVNGNELSDQASEVVNDDDIVLLDVSWGDETNDESTGSGYEDGHVPGTVHVNTDEYETPTVYVEEKDDDYKSEWRLNSDEDLIQLAGEKGITKDSCVVITGYEPMATTRMAVILKYLGCDNVHVMSEGLVGWKANGYEMETGINKAKAVSFGTDTPENPDLIDTIEEVKENLGNDDFQLVDTRTEEEYNGEDTGYGYHDLAGCIEGTLLSPSGIGYSSSMYYYRNPDKSMRTKEVLEAMWSDQGIDTSKHMSFFCGSGWRAAEVVWDALVLGYEDVSLYSDGWIGWSNEGN